MFESEQMNSERAQLCIILYPVFFLHLAKSCTCTCTSMQGQAADLLCPGKYMGRNLGLGISHWLYLLAC